MVWTENRLKILLILIRGEERTLLELTTDIGFKNPQNIRVHINALVRQKYVSIVQAEPKENPSFRFNHDLSAIVALYQDRHYKSIREELRAHPRILASMTQSYGTLPEDVQRILRDMIQKSNSFFEYILENPAPDQLLHTFRFMLYPINLIADITDELKFILLIQELYAMAIARDLKRNGLADGFCEPLKGIRRIFSNQYQVLILKQREFTENERLETESLIE